MHLRFGMVLARWPAWRKVRAAALRLCLSAVLLYALSSFLAGAPARAGGAGTVVRCQPSVASGPYTGTLAVDLYIENVTDLYGADLRLSFDYTRTQVVDADPNVAGVQIQLLSGFLSPDFVLRQEADNGAGTARYAATQLNPHDPVSGSGAVARITFQASQAGSFTIPFTYQKLTRRDGTQIPATAQSCTVQFLPLQCADFNGGVLPRIDDVMAVASRWNDSARYSLTYDLAPVPVDGVIDPQDIRAVAGVWHVPCP